ncbi:MAG: hypothetical protein JWM80_4575 [Cyanobacteria bacterium RYN_339]|nr:hypothetical protein [Cyanobacteria bacterium RYN_339]
MSLSPLRPVAYQAPVSPYQAYQAAPAPVQAPLAAPLAPAGPGVAAVAHAAMTGQQLPGASPLQTSVLGLVQRGQAAMKGIADHFFPAPPPRLGVLATTPLTLTEKLQKVGRAALFFALPVGGAAAVACGLGWVVGPWVPFIGGHVFGAVCATLAVGQTAGMLLHGSMRLPLITNPEDREYNSAGATAASAGMGALFAAGIWAAAGNPVTLPLVLAGAAIGALPRILEWGIGHH